MDTNYPSDSSRCTGHISWRFNNRRLHIYLRVHILESRLLCFINVILKVPKILYMSLLIKVTLSVQQLSLSE